MSDESGSRIGSGAKSLCLAGALGAAGLLAFGAFAKGYSLKTHGKLLTGFSLDHGVMIAEVVIAGLVLAFYRRWFTWLGLLVMFAGFSGYTFYHVLRGGSCGCLGDWTPEARVMFSIDLVAVVIAAALAFVSRAPRAMLAMTAVAALGAAFVGNFTSYRRTPEAVVEKYAGQDAKSRLLACDLAAELRDAPPGGPAYLVFIHEIGCHVCEQYLDTMEQWQTQLDAESNSRLRVRVWSKDQVFDACGIEDWAWEGPPHSFLVIDGHPAAFPNGKAMEWLGEDTPFTLVDDLKAMLETDSMYPLFPDAG